MPTVSSPDHILRIYIAPNADDLPSWVASMQHIAKEGRCFVISVNQFCKVSQPADLTMQLAYAQEGVRFSSGLSTVHTRAS
jgi:hypothetical protein